MSEFDYDLFVIGGGSGGVRAARIAAQHGASVAIAEEYRYGGTCVIRGCVPKKLMVYASQFTEHFEDAAGFGWTVGETSFDWPRFIERKDLEITRLENAYRRNLGNAGVEIHETRAVLTGPHTVRLESHQREVSARHILIAVGGTPFIPDFEGSEHVITSDEIFHLPEFPKRVMIVGGGYIACEFACILNGMGAEVTQVYRGEQILRGFDGEVRGFVHEEMQKKGVKITLNANVERVEKQGDGLLVTLTDGQTCLVDQALYATGRVPKTDGLGLESAGIKTGRNGEIIVDQWSQTSCPSVFAVGDVTNRVNLTPVAIREGHAFADTVFGGQQVSADHSLIATAVFTQPEIGTVGMSEEQALAELGQGGVEIYSARFRPMLHTLSGRDEKVLMKLVVAKEARTVLGVHIVGHGAGELIQALGIAVKMGATKEDFDRTVAVHPTAAEELVTMRTPTR
ncbi:MAG: glutathione-disulfide reductase [Neomegalonema sp.]|nr:glutathione-disulfide reductase [Neomegalonema sp.]